MRVLTLGLIPVIQLGIRHPRKKESKWTVTWERNDSQIMVQ